MKALKFIILFLIGFCCPWLWSQSTTVSVAIHSPNGQEWSFGTLTYIFKPAPNFSGKSQWQGADLPSNYLVSTTIALDNIGSAVFSLPSNNLITPAGSQWTITVCPAATVQCQTTPVAVSGGTQDISPTLNAQLSNISLNGTMVPLAYDDTDIMTQVRAGSLYYNTITNQARIYTGTIWTALGGGGGGTPAGVNLDNQINLGGNFGADSGVYTYNPTTHTLGTENQNITGSITQSLSSTLGTGPAVTNTYNYPQPVTPAGSFSDGIFNYFLTTDASGPEKAIGNPPNMPQSGPFAGDSGWRVTKGLEMDMHVNTAGIAQWMHFDGYKNGTSDNAIIYMFGGVGWTTGGWTAASDEATDFIVGNSTQFPGLCLGTVTSTTGAGDIHPAVQCTHGGVINLIVSDGYLFDLSKKLATTHMVGSISTTWASNTLGLGLIAVTPGSVTPSTGACQLATYLPASPNLVQPVANTGMSCTPIFGTMVNGQAWAASFDEPEQVTLSAVSGSNMTITSAKPHANVTTSCSICGTIIFQGGTQGSFSPADDFSIGGNLMDIITFGATDNSHLIIGERKASGINGNALPISGMWASGNNLTGEIDVYPMANVVSVDSTGSGNLQLEQNSVHWANGDNIASPFPSAYVEALAVFISSQQSYANASSSSVGLVVNGGPGWSYNSYLIAAGMNATPSFYRGWGLGGAIDPPNGLSLRHATLGQIVAFTTPIPSIANSQIPCILCNYDDGSLAINHAIALYVNGNATNSGVYMDYPRFTTDFDTLASVRSETEASAIRLTTDFSSTNWSLECFNDVNVDTTCEGFQAANPFTPGFHILNGRGGPFDYNGAAICTVGVSCYTPVTFTVPVSTTVGANSCSSGTGITVAGTSSASSVTLPTPTTNITAITGWSVVTGSLSISLVPSTNTLTWAVCNPSTSSITTGANVTFNTRVIN